MNILLLDNKYLQSTGKNDSNAVGCHLASVLPALTSIIILRLGKTIPVLIEYCLQSLLPQLLKINSWYVSVSIGKDDTT